MLSPAMLFSVRIWLMQSAEFMFGRSALQMPPRVSPDTTVCSAPLALIGRTVGVGPAGWGLPDGVVTAPGAAGEAC
jgi:hypothetical protein